MQAKAKLRKDYRAPEFTVTDIHLDFQLDENRTLVTTQSQLKRLNSEATKLFLYGHSCKLLEVKLNGEQFTHYEIDKEGMTLDLSRFKIETFELEITTELEPANNTSLQGLYKSGEALCTQCEAEGFRQITYSMDRPDVLARYTTKITADKAKYPFLLSNGNRIASGDLDNGRHWIEWQDPFPKPSYLFALVAGDFDLLQDNFITKSGRNVALELYVDKGNLNRANWAMESLKSAMKWDEERFDLEYDLDIYMIVAVDFFNMGAMENKGLNVFNSKFVLANPETATDADYLAVEAVIGHEYFHNWTGNRVTCRDWFQLSLKEGLTVFREQEFSADMGSRAAHRINNVKILRTLQFAEDSGPMSHPIRPDKVIEMNNFYTMTVYEKGSEVIRMLHTLLGEERFQQGMKYYIEANDGKAATCDDFVDAMQKAYDGDLTLFKRWYSQSGTPKLIIRDEYDNKGQVYRLHVTQLNEPTADQMNKANLHIPLVIELYQQDGTAISLINGESKVSNVLDVTKKEQVFEFSHVYSRPVPALLCDFSAPVKLEYSYTPEQLFVLMKYAKNEFVRWDATQMLFTQVLQENVHRYQQGQPLEMSEKLIAALAHVLTHYEQDLELTALMLALPTEMEISENFNVIDPQAIHDVRKFMQYEIGNALAAQLSKLYHNIATGTYKVTQEDVAKRSLRNVCLSYLAVSKLGNGLVKAHFEDADNMTDTLAAMKAAFASELPCRDELSNIFEEKWRHDGLVMDKWFNLHATRPDANVLQIVESLFNHPSFNFNNPNRLRALVGSFVNGNPKAFHAIDGSGYRFLVEVLIKLNSVNPQVASRLVEPLIRFKRYDNQRQTLMKRGLERLAALENLSKDLYEKVEKALS